MVALSGGKVSLTFDVLVDMDEWEAFVDDVTIFFADFAELFEGDAAGIDVLLTDLVLPVEEAFGDDGEEELSMMMMIFIHEDDEEDEVCLLESATFCFVGGFEKLFHDDANGLDVLVDSDDIASERVEYVADLVLPVVEALDEVRLLESATFCSVECFDEPF